jgi:hypothetical protein
MCREKSVVLLLHDIQNVQALDSKYEIRKGFLGALPFPHGYRTFVKPHCYRVYSAPHW